MMDKQRGYINLDGFFSGLLIAGAILGAIACAVLLYGVPWLWDLIRPWLHEVTK